MEYSVELCNKITDLRMCADKFYKKLNCGFPHDDNDLICCLKNGEDLMDSYLSKNTQPEPTHHLHIIFSFYYFIIQTEILLASNKIKYDIKYVKSLLDSLIEYMEGEKAVA
jgi:hypothetical protein